MNAARLLQKACWAEMELDKNLCDMMLLGSMVILSQRYVKPSYLLRLSQKAVCDYTKIVTMLNLFFPLPAPKSGNQPSEHRVQHSDNGV